MVKYYKCEQQELLRYLGHGSTTWSMRAGSEWVNPRKWRILSMSAPSQGMKPSSEFSCYSPIVSLSH